ncbi:MAG: hypothetical protein HOH58_15465 [Opitutaceae bacterium]|nr:hypothetical protein [Opitutaceae bacterium]
MKRLALFALSLVAPLSAFAHPGHPGHDFEWDFIPTVGTVAVILGLVMASGLWLRRRRHAS